MTLRPVNVIPISVFSRVIVMEVTYRASHAHLDEQQGLLPGSQLAQAHCPKTTDRHSADRDVQRIDVCDRIPSVGGM